MGKSALDDNEVKVEVLRLVNDGWSYREIEDRIGVPKTTLNKFVLRQTHKEWWEENPKPVAAGELKDHHENIRKLEGKRFIITSAQNNTYVHSKFLASLQTAAEDLDAEIIVGTFSYNTNGFQNLEKGEGEWFDPKVKDYILDEPVQLADGLLWCGELNILPTAVNPLSGLHSYTRSSSGIIPHAKVQLESLPTHKTEPCRMLYTTGTVTLRNYIEKKTGQKASFHHVFGALIVEVDDDGDWFVRQLIADSDSGEFQDLDTLYTPNDKVTSVDVEAINWGDIHNEKLDPEVADTSFHKPDSILNVLQPTYQFIHDVIDHEARNHHNIKDPYFRYEMFLKGKESVEKNVDDVASFLESVSRPYCKTVVVESNHDLALKRWLREADYKSDPVNAVFFLESQLTMYKMIQRGEANGSLLGEIVTQKMNENISDDMPEDLQVVVGNKAIFLTQDESFKICNSDGNGIECGSHGHLGSNGSRGGIGVYQKLGSRYNIGHSHTAAIKDGVYVAGVSADLDMGYNQGASSWSHSHVITYPNGKRTIVTLKNGKWRA